MTPLRLVAEPTVESRLAASIRRLDALKAELREVEAAILQDGRAYIRAQGCWGVVRVERLRRELGI